MRDAFRARLIAHKTPRRMALGDRVTLIFENRETIRFQVQEMMRVEGIRDPEKIQHELDVYNELVPGGGELSATLMIEITDLADIRSELDRLVGLDEHLSLLLEGRPPIAARFDEKQLEEDRLAAVQYIRFQLPADAEAAFCDESVEAAVRVDHPNYRIDTAIPRETRRSLIEDLQGGIPPLLEVPEGAGVLDSAHRVLEESDGIRVRHPHRPAGPGHVVVEAVDPVDDWLAAPPARWAALQAVLKRHGDAIQQRHGACRVMSDLGAGPRFHLFAPR